MKKPLIRAVNLSKWYGEVIGLNSFNMEVNHGITGIVGPNGSGKSTMFKLIIGMIKANKGQLYVMGEKPWLNSELSGKIGFCPDYDNLPNDATGNEFLQLVGGLHGMKDIHLKTRIKECSETVGIDYALDRKIGGYSKGMRQRIKVAGAILHDPDLLLLDEPLSGADPQARRSLIEVIKTLHGERGHDIIVSSHVLFEVERMTRDVVLIYKGRAVASGDISEIRNLIDKHPHNIIVEGSGMVELGKKLLEADYTVSVSFDGSKNRLRVEVTRPDEFFNMVPRMVLGIGGDIKEMYSLDDNLEAVFKYLVGR
ncbi:MAG: ABC transporter ATP-binding protein [Thermoplasmata archaeon]